MNERPEILDESGIGIVGVGLIGGSIAVGLKARGYSGKIIGFGRNADRLQAAQTAGLIDEFAIEPNPLVKQVSLIVVCTPVDRIVEDVRRFAESSRPGTVITDVGSVKGEICWKLSDYAAREVSFVGAHPLAGSEKNGFEHAVPDLFEDRICFITPDSASKPRDLRRVEEFWSFLGMRIHTLAPSEHDRLMSVTSHTPHLIAAATALLLEEKDRPFTGTGFQDTTRIAAGDPGLWRAILYQNRQEVSRTLKRFSEIISILSQAIEYGDRHTLEQLLEQAKNNRDSLVS
jgi:prephenate dehydrogenase